MLLGPFEVIVRVMANDSLGFSPPLIITKDEINEMLDRIGKALDDQGDKKGAVAAYKALVDNLSFAQCWDPKGWFWSPADAARKRLAELQFDAAQ